jgi:hypothetical protein
MDELCGCRIADRALDDRPGVLRFTEPWGPFVGGEELALPPGDGTLATRGVRLRASDADTIAVDANGDPAMVMMRRGSGVAVTCAYPLEILLAARPDAHGPGDASWGVYGGLAALIDARAAASCDHPDVTLGELRGPAGGLVTITNHADREVSGSLRLPRSDVRIEWERPDAGGGAVVEDGRVAFELEGYGAAVVAWRA